MCTIRRMPSGKYPAVVRVNGYKPKYKIFADKSSATQWATTLEEEINRTTTTSLVTTGSPQKR